ncbi:MAG: glucosyltransferase domain-containing protein [Alphaproteobacteria bacterium]|nr:glucosyltransferase domain-containing protein [Alphaproteobacteria bacterium]
MTTFIEKLDSRLKIIFVSVAVGMIVAHGMTVFNKYAVHDEVGHLFGTIEYVLFRLNIKFGRWGLDLFQYFVSHFWGRSGEADTFSMPLMSGLYIVFFLSLTVFFIVKLLNIKNTVTCFLLGALFVTYPFMATLFAFNFLAPYYIFSLFLSVAGAFLLCQGKKIYFLSGIFAVVFSLSIYQAFFPITLSLIFLFFIKNVSDDAEKEEKSFYKIFFYLAGCGLALGIYLGISYWLVHSYNTSLTGYQHIDKMGQEGFFTYIRRVGVAYSEFFSPLSSFPLNTKYIYYLVLLLCFTLQLFLCAHFPVKKKCQTLLLVLVFPLAVNFVYIMCPHDDSESYRIVTLALWIGHLMVFVWFSFLLENIHASKAGAIRKAGYIVLSVMVLMCGRIDNICYFQIAFNQARTNSYFTSLIAQIKNTEGYRQEYPVAYINEFDKQDGNVKDMPFLNPSIPPYWGTKWLINNYAWKEFVAYWCAYKPDLVSGKDFENLPEVQAMPRYPDYGSIKVINNTVVVKF